ncbi:unnamed protein product [marine sediment metagenome]|uniref:Single-stranded DNA-binding protein n=1 Tax=marine sediment metagenome TaxID=412755 RepID=X0UEL4_9ZZZZ
MLNFCILTGNLGADPEIRYSNNGDPHFLVQPRIQIREREDKLVKNYRLQSSR